MDFEKVLALFRAMNDQKVDYVVFGGIALGAHGIVRATVDVDLFVDPAPDNIARLRSALRSVWDDPEIEQITAEDLEEAIPRSSTDPLRRSSRSTCSRGGGRLTAMTISNPRSS